MASLRATQTNTSALDPGELFCYNIINQQAVADKSIADCVEALIGECGCGIEFHFGYLFQVFIC